MRVDRPVQLENSEQARGKGWLWKRKKSFDLFFPSLTRFSFFLINGDIFGKVGNDILSRKYKPGEYFSPPPPNQSSKIVITFLYHEEGFICTWLVLHVLLYLYLTGDAFTPLFVPCWWCLYSSISTWLVMHVLLCLYLAGDACTPLFLPDWWCMYSSLCRTLSRGKVPMLWWRPTKQGWWWPTGKIWWWPTS